MLTDSIVIVKKGNVDYDITRRNMNLRNAVKFNKRIVSNVSLNDPVLKT